MNNVFILMAFLFSFSTAFAQTTIEAITGTTLSPFAAATRVLESGTVTVLAPFASTIALAAQHRGVAGREQLKDDLVALNDDMISGAVKSIEEVRQPALKELFIEIEADENQMSSINAVVADGSDLHRIATAVTIALLAK